MELLKFCAVCVIMTISQLEFSEAEMEHFDLVAGDPLVITCVPNLRVTTFISGTAHLLMRQPNNNILFRNIDAKNLQDYPEELYSMTLNTDQASMAVFNFNFKSLRVSDSGLWQCVTEANNQHTFFRNMTFSVKPAEDVGRVEVSLVKAGDGKEVNVIQVEGGADPTTEDVTLLSGTYTMTCAAEKGYPAPEYSLFMNGQTFSNKQEATFNLTTADTNVGCKVEVHRKEFSDHTLHFDLKIEEIEPEIQCLTTSARVNDGKAVMNCTVVAADVTCKKVVWKSGTTNQDFVHGSNVIGYDLSCKSNGVNSVWSSLAVRDLEPKHFEDTFFIQIKDTKTGSYQKEHKLQIVRKPGALNGSVQIRASVGSLALVAVVTLLKMVL